MLPVVFYQQKSLSGELEKQNQLTIFGFQVKMKQMSNFRSYLTLLFIFICLILNELNLFSQGRYGFELPNNSLENLTSLKGSLYNGIDNFIRIDPRVIDCENILFTCTNGTIVRDTLNIYLIIPKRQGNARIILNCLNSSDTSVLGYRNYMVYNLPDPKITFNNKPIDTPVTLSKYELFNCDTIGVFFSEDIPGSDKWFRVKSFTIGYTYGGFHVSHSNNSNVILPETKQLIAKLGPDHEISLVCTVETDGKITKQLPIYRIRFY
jgi:hypothetical protein